MPTPKQELFLKCEAKEVLFGGQAGGGKSDALLMAALQYVSVPGYAAILFRRTFPELDAPGGLIPRSTAWLEATDARWDGKRSLWTFPRSGAVLKLSSMQLFKDRLRQKGAEYDMIGFDELTSFQEAMYRYMYSRRRHTTKSQAPLRVMAASNPGDVGHDWVKARLIEPKTRKPSSVFIPSTLEDNPYIDTDEYDDSLQELFPHEYQQLRWGDWDAVQEGEMFKRQYFSRFVVMEDLPDEVKKRLIWCRYWDLAGTEKKEGKNPDWTAGALVALDPTAGDWYIVDMVRFQMAPADTENTICAVAEVDSRKVRVRIEEEGGASGKFVTATFAKRLIGFDFDGIPSTKAKPVRARPVSSAARNARIFMVRGQWNRVFIDNAIPFPTEGVPDDEMDALSGCFKELSTGIISPTGVSTGDGSGPKKPREKSGEEEADRMNQEHDIMGRDSAWR